MPFAVWLRLPKNNLSVFRLPQHPVMACKHVWPVSLLQPPNNSGKKTLQVRNCFFVFVFSALLCRQSICWNIKVILFFIFFVISNFYPILLSCLEEWLVKGTVKISHAHISLSPLRAYKCSVRTSGVGIFQYDFFRGNSALGLFG